MASTPERLDPERLDPERLDHLLHRFVDRRRHVHHGVAAVSVLDGAGGGPSWSGACGGAWPGGPPLEVTTPIRIASVSKLFTAAVVMRLVEQGGLALGDRAVDRLPGGAIDGLHRLDGVDRTGQITVEHLLSHTSGLADYFEDAPKGGSSLQQRLLTRGDEAVDWHSVVATVRDELTPHFSPQDLGRPRARARYSDTNFQVLGAVVEHTCGAPYTDVLRRLVLDPLELRHTHASGSPPQGLRPAAVWHRGRPLELDGALAGMAPDGGLVSTVDDLVQFLSAVVEGRLFDRSATWERMTDRFRRVYFPIGYGLGVMRVAMSRWLSPAAPIPACLGHSGSTASWLYWCPSARLVTAGTFDQAAGPSLPYRFLAQVLRQVR